MRVQSVELLGLSYTSKRLGLTKSDLVSGAWRSVLPIFDDVELPTRGEHEDDNASINSHDLGLTNGEARAESRW